MPQRLFRVGSNGTVHVSAFELPLSAALSDQAREAFQSRQMAQQVGLPRLDSITTDDQLMAFAREYRKLLDENLAIPLSEKLAIKHPVSVTSKVIGGVQVEEFVPTGEIDPERILINLHGGAYLCGATHIARRISQESSRSRWQIWEDFELFPWTIAKRRNTSSPPPA